MGDASRSVTEADTNTKVDIIERKEMAATRSKADQIRRIARAAMFRVSSSSPETFRTPVVCAPMVDQSELPFRMLCRKYGVKLCWTPMLHSRLFAENEKYRKEKFTTCEGDRPLVVQFCGNEPETILRAAKLVEDKCDAVDLNLGCPQGIARKGNYGSFLLEDADLLERIVSHLDKNLSIPVTCKIRLLPAGIDATIDLCKRLEAAGCALLTVHGRTRFQNKQLVGSCNWNAIKAIKEALDIPVLANGGTAGYDDLVKCMDATGVNAVMSSEALLENPSMFLPTPELNQIKIALGYIDECRLNHPGNMKIVKAHMFKFLYPYLFLHTDIRSELGTTGRGADLDDYEAILHKLEKRFENDPDKLLVDPSVNWYMRHRSEKPTVSSWEKKKSKEEKKKAKAERKKRKREMKAQRKIEVQKLQEAKRAKATTAQPTMR